MGSSSTVLYTFFTTIIFYGFSTLALDHRPVVEQLGSCKACKVYVELFEKGAQKYVNQPTDRNSESLSKIRETLCTDPRIKQQCLETATQADPFIAEWWLRDEPPDLYQYLCIDKLQVCCPERHYGKDCLPCHGDLENICSGNGKCRGDGTRKGNGTCLCDTGYAGEFCNECASGYYSTTEDGKFQCNRCHFSCMGGCHQGSQKDCVSCRPGFTFETDEGCTDINECNNLNTCGKDEFCLNSKGSFKCLPCDRACKGCYGDSPDMCRKCAKGFSRKGDMCIQDRVDEEMDQMTVTRYITYIGLLVAAGVLMPRSSYLGAAVGILVLSYIVGAEYYCAINGYASLLELTMFSV